MLWRRDILEAGGSIEALGAEIAEDAAATKVIRAQGLNAHLVDRPFQQPLGRRRLRDVWSRQLRWARLRRATFPFFFAPEILTTSLLTFVAAAVAAPDFGIDPIVGVALMAAFWYGAEAILAFAAGWPLSWRSPAAWLVRDAPAAVPVGARLVRPQRRLARQRYGCRRRRVPASRVRTAATDLTRPVWALLSAIPSKFRSTDLLSLRSASRDRADDRANASRRQPRRLKISRCLDAGGRDAVAERRRACCAF